MPIAPLGVGTPSGLSHVPEELAVQNLVGALEELESLSTGLGLPVALINPGIPVYFSPYALPEATYVPAIGIVCLDEAALDRYRAKVKIAKDACDGC